MPYHESSRITLIAAAPIARASLVKLESGGLKVCGADGTPVGFTELGAAAAGDHVSVRLMNAQGTFECRAAGSITPGALLMPAADGAVAPTAAARSSWAWPCPPRARMKRCASFPFFPAHHLLLPPGREPDAR